MKFRSADDERRYIEGLLTADESRRVLSWEHKHAQLQSALEADLIDGFEMEPIDLGSDELKFSFQSKPQIEQLL